MWDALNSLLWTMSFGLIPYPVSVTSMRTTIHSSGGGFECVLLCCVRCDADNRCGKGGPLEFSEPSLASNSSAPNAPFPSHPLSLSGGDGARSGSTSFVVIVSLPPAGVNLHALLGHRREMRSGQQQKPLTLQG